MKHLILLLVRFYRFILSPLLLAVFGPACRYEPSCSVYMLQAVETHGAMRGSIFGLKRLCRCHPWGGSGYDPIPPLPSSASALTCE